MKRSTVIRLLAVALALVSVVMLVACDDDGGSKKEINVEGKWELSEGDEYIIYSFDELALTDENGKLGHVSLYDEDGSVFTYTSYFYRIKDGKIEMTSISSTMLGGSGEEEHYLTFELSKKDGKTVLIDENGWVYTKVSE